MVKQQIKGEYMYGVAKSIVKDLLDKGLFKPQEADRIDKLNYQTCTGKTT